MPWDKDAKSWIKILQKQYESEKKKSGNDYDGTTCCAEQDAIYNPDTENTVAGFTCGGMIVGGHVLMEQTHAAQGVDNGTVYMLPICNSHNTSLKCNPAHQGDGYYMKLSRAMKPLILNNYKHRELAAYLDNGRPNVSLAADNAEKIVGIDISYCQDGLSFDEVKKWV